MRRHRRLAGWLGNDPHRPAVGRLLLLLALLVVGVWGFFALLGAVLDVQPIEALDVGVYQFLREIRTPWGDAVMVVFTELADGVVLLPLATAIAAWLLFRRHWRLAAYWCATLGAGFAAVLLFKLLLRQPHPVWLPPDQGPFAYAFPSLHAAAGATLFGLLAVLVTRSWPPRYRWIAFSAAAVLVLLIAFSRLYLGAHWFSDVAGGLALGLVAVVLFTIAAGRRAETRRPVRGIGPVALLALLIPATVHVHTDYAADRLRYAPQYPLRTIAATAWWGGDWRGLRRFRHDIGGEREQPLNLQWAGELPAIREQLQRLGWRRPVPLSPSTALRWLAPRMPLSQLPIPPLLDAGREEALVMIRPADAVGRQQVLRLWPADIRLSPGGTPLWLGSVSEQTVRNFVLLRVPLTRAGEAPLAQLARQLIGRAPSQLQHPTGLPDLLLVCSPCGMQTSRAGARSHMESEAR